jgi:ribonuclease HI
MIKETLTLEFDGGSRGNPGPAGIGVVIRAQDGTPLVTLGRFIGPATNNVAEYKALITALEEARKLGAKKIAVRGDSELVVRQMLGVYRVKHPDLKLLYAQARELFDQFSEASIEHNLRGKNALADELANRAMDRRAEVTDADGVVDLQQGGEPATAAAGEQFTCPRCGCTIEVRRAASKPVREPRDFLCQCGGRMRG